MAGQRPGRNAQIVDRGIKVQASHINRVVAPEIAANGIADETDMDALDNGMTAEQRVTVASEMTVGHFVAQMPQVYATPMASGAAIGPRLPEGFVSVGMDVKVRHLAATPVGRTVRAVSRVIKIDPKSVVFEVEAWDGDRKIGDGTHRRGIVNVLEFERRYGVRQLTMGLD
jgi:fluoroacetyl-CoA thioesterase